MSATNSNSRTYSHDDDLAGRLVPLRAVICYDSPASGLRGVRQLSRLPQEEFGEIDLQLKPWRFDVILDPAAYGEAIADVCSADLIVIASDQAPSIDATRKIAPWLFAQIENRNPQPALLFLPRRGRARFISAPAGEGPTFGAERP